MECGLGIAATFPSCLNLKSFPSRLNLKSFPSRLKSPKLPLFTINCHSLSLSNSPGYVKRPWKVADARLVLEDGSIWPAKLFGASGTQVGEVVFNTSLTGYQEILTDPQFVPSLSISTSNWRCADKLGEYLASRNVMEIYDADTHAITRRLRQDGSLVKMSTKSEWDFNLGNKRNDEAFRVLVYDYGVNHNILRRLASYGCEIAVVPSTWPETLKMEPDGVLFSNGPGWCPIHKAPHEWVDRTKLEWDFNLGNKRNDEAFSGVNHNILRRLASYGCEIIVVPSTWPAYETLEMEPDGVLFSNGPGDPSAVPYAVEAVKEIIGKVPVFGICMGHQLLGQALGGKTFKMKFDGAHSLLSIDPNFAYLNNNGKCLWCEQPMHITGCEINKCVTDPDIQHFSTLRDAVDHLKSKRRYYCAIDGEGFVCTSGLTDWYITKKYLSKMSKPKKCGCGAYVEKDDIHDHKNQDGKYRCPLKQNENSDTREKRFMHERHHAESVDIALKERGL